MKVLMINSHFTAGGPPRVMNGIYDFLKEKGVECRIAAARGITYNNTDSYKIDSKKDILVNAVLSRVFDNEGLNAKKSTKKLIHEIERYNPDIIHIHNIHGYYLNYEVLFSYFKHCTKPIVWTLHDLWAITGHCSYFSMLRCDKWQRGCYNCPQIKQYPKSLFSDHSESNWKRKKRAFLGIPNLTLVCVSKWQERIIKNSFLSNYNSLVLYNGIDLAPFSYRDSNIKSEFNLQNKKVILGVALHWTQRKGILDYIQLASQLGDDYRIMMVGLSKGEIKNLPSNVIPIGPVFDDKRLSEIYSAADICLNLSYEETFGLTSIESLACGTPIITYDQTAVPEISSMFGSPVVHAGNIEELIKKIESLFSEGTPVKKLHVDVSFFEQKRKYEEYYNLYCDLLTRNSMKEE